MQLRYVFSETGTGLRRNVSMSIALIVTIFVSLTLVGMGLLLNSQADQGHRDEQRQAHGDVHRDVATQTLPELAEDVAQLHQTAAP